jgi:hypothetical protein
MSKEQFVEFCLDNFEITENHASDVWDKYQDFKNHIQKNWDNIKDMRSFSKEERLALRTQASNHGQEYTPDEIDRLIEFISFAQDKMTRGD